MKNVLIIDYGSGNLRSVYNAFLKVADSDTNIKVSDNPQDLDWASHVVLPGVGAFADCMYGLTSRPALHEALVRLVYQHAYMPILGICVGMQMLFQRGLEHGEHAGLGWLKGEVIPLKPSPLEGEGWVGGASSFSVHGTAPLPNPPPQGGREFKIPHMGWNNLTIKRDHPLMYGIKNGDHAYFVHSYYAKTSPENIIATTDYGVEIPAIVGRDNIMGTQFHPEKSQASGLAILQNFLRMS